MTFSVITVCRNAGSQIEKTIKSMLAQTNTDMEHIFIDGASGDDTVEKIMAHQAEYEEKGMGFTCISEPDEGIYDAMNKGLAMAKGEWVLLLNAGDSYHDENVFAELAKAISRFGVDILAGSMVFAEGYLGRIYRSQNPKNLKQDMALMHSAMCVRRKLYDERKFSTEYRISGDYEWTLYQYLNKAKIEVIDILMVDFDGNGISNQNRQLAIEENCEIQRRYGLPVAQHAPGKPNMKSRIYKKLAYKKLPARLYYLSVKGKRDDIFWTGK